MANRTMRSTVFGVLVIAAALLVAVPASAQVVMKVNDNVFFRFGIQIQSWADFLQDATTRGYGENLFIRRARFLVTGQVAPNVTFLPPLSVPFLAATMDELTATSTFLRALVITHEPR